MDRIGRIRVDKVASRDQCSGFHILYGIGADDIRKEDVGIREYPAGKAGEPAQQNADQQRYENFLHDLTLP